MPHVVGVKQMSLGMLGKDGALYLSDPELLSLSKLCTDLPFERDQHVQKRRRPQRSINGGKRGPANKGSAFSHLISTQEQCERRYKYVQR